MSILDVDGWAVSSKCLEVFRRMVEVINCEWQKRFTESDKYCTFGVRKQPSPSYIIKWSLKYAK
jgi:hypothetical protein